MSFFPSALFLLHGTNGKITVRVAFKQLRILSNGACLTPCTRLTPERMDGDCLDSRACRGSGRTLGNETSDKGHKTEIS